MNRIQEVFGVPRVLLPVIHPISMHEAMRNVELAVRTGCQGVFVIDQGMSAEEVLELILVIRGNFPDFWVGLNLRGARPAEVLRRGLEGCHGRLDGIWADNAYVNENSENQPDAEEFLDARRKARWNGLYFGGVAFKYQREVRPEDLGKAAAKAQAYMDVVCTSGPGTGREAQLDKVAAMKAGLGTDGALALASGVTEANVAAYLPHVNAYLVGTGIEMQFGVFDVHKLFALQKLISGEVHAEPEEGPR